jgi:SsrA-binding protein
VKTVAKNRRATFDYEIFDRMTAGIVLSGQEAKSAREGHADLAGAYVSFRGNVPILKHLKIRRYRFAADIGDYDPARDRVLLLKKSEAAKLKVMSEQKGVAVIPLEVQAGTFIKVVLAVARGRKTVDKRSRIKERDVEKRLRTQGED